jgi:hypothetical protein
LGSLEGLKQAPYSCLPKGHMHAHAHFSHTPISRAHLMHVSQVTRPSHHAAVMYAHSDVKSSPPQIWGGG